VHTYAAYGLGIRSALPLPELSATAEITTDAVIHLGRIERPLPETDHTGCHFEMDREEAYLFWEEVGAFLVRRGREIVIEPVRGVEGGLLRLPLLGAVLAVLLYQRGFLVLHASAVALKGEAVAFLGERGYGKSTMAAALYARGHVLVADDFVAVDVCRPGRPSVLPGFPQLKLFSEAAAAALHDDPGRLPWIAHGYEKRARRAEEGFSLQPLPLGRIYLLGGGAVPEIVPVPPRETFLQLIGHSYVGRLFQQSGRGPDAASHFRQCVTLARDVPVRWLRRPPSLAALPGLARMVEAEMDLRSDAIG
jgi:hypothetical protein